jgi:hypothetical protein
MKTILKFPASPQQALKAPIYNQSVPLAMQIYIED